MKRIAVAASVTLIALLTACSAARPGPAAGPVSPGALPDPAKAGWICDATACWVPRDQKAPRQDTAGAKRH